MVVLGIAVALSVQVVGSLLVLALLITPSAAALQVTASPLKALILSVIFAELAIVGGILLALAGSLPISPLCHQCILRNLSYLPHYWRN